MTATFEECPVLPRFELRAPDGSTVAIDEVSMKLRRGADGDAAEIRLLFQVDGERWDGIDKKRLFHLEPEVRGATFAGGFETGGPPIEIETRVDAKLLPRFEAKGREIHHVAAELLVVPKTDPLRATESYFALFVKQERHPGVKAGLKTKWADAPA